MVTGLCLIDCRTRTVVAAPADVEYVALSYCWGRPQAQAQPNSQGWFPWKLWRTPVQHTVIHSEVAADGEDFLGPLPTVVPVVISDAMLVTTMLGFSYLWVDRYCIDQNSATKHTQISQMDSIYQGAELTIIVAARKDPSYGLPGVGFRPRQQQLACSAGDLDFWSTMSNPHETIKISAWCKRAWTFQEGILSRRRLVFTDEQVYYECAAMNCWESITSDLDELHTEDKSKFRECLRSGFFGIKDLFSTGGFGETSRSPKDNMVLLRDMTEQYTERDLTYDTDSLNAFVGILRLFENLQPPVANIWGVPLLRSLDAEGKDLVKETDASFVASLAWKHVYMKTSSGSRIHPRRRDGFPSWSWCGWQGGISCISSPSESLLQSVALEDDGGAVLTPTKYLELANPTRRYCPAPSVLWITGFVLPQTAFTISHARKGPRHDYCIFGRSSFAFMSVGPEGAVAEYKSFTEDNSRRCVCLGEDVIGVTFLVLQRHGSNWQRIGLIWVRLESPESDEARHFWKSWLEYETKSSVPLDDVRQRLKELPVTSFRII